MKKILSAVLAMLIVISYANAMAPSAEQARKAELAAAENLKSDNIMIGDETGDLNLAKTVTRAEFVVLMDKAGCFSEISDYDAPNFTDVDSTHWAYNSISKACRAGVISGFGDGTFRPDEPVLYEQAVKMVISTITSWHEYPIGFIGEAIDKGINDDVRGEIGESLNRGNSAILIKNLLDYADSENDVDEYFTGVKGNAAGRGMLFSPALKSVDTGSLETGAVAEEMPVGGSTAIIGIPYPEYRNAEEYDYQDENIFKNVLTSPLSTFSIDVDTASYSNVRRFLTGGNMPSDGAVRIEELINYFDYDLPQPEGDAPFAITTELHDCPWNSDNKLAMISLKGKELSEADELPNNLVFLIDTSGSMYSYNRLPLVQRSLDLLLNQLDEKDTVSIVTYAGSAGIALKPTPASEKETISETLNSLYASGSTAGAEGIETAYKLAEENKTDGNNRIILCTDGDFNVGVTNNKTLEELISEKKESGIFLTILGFGMGNYKDNRMEMLADCGNGNYAYIDTLKEAKKVLSDDLNKTLYTIAKDVKIQVEFNPAKISQYRLVGYENRRLENEDFDNDQKDGGEVGAGHSVTAFYELVGANENQDTQQLRYSESVLSDSDELMYVKVRYKEPDSDESKLTEYAITYHETEEASQNYIFASAVAEFGMLLNKSDFIKDGSYSDVKLRAKSALGDDKFGIRNEFVQLVDIAEFLDNMNV